MNNQKTCFAIVAIVAAVGLAVSAVASNAAITSNCRNPSGNENSGCNEHNTGDNGPQTKQNENPAGHPPPGQVNK